MINSSVCVTKLNSKIISWLDKNGRIELLSVSDADKDIIGNIYVAKVKNVVKNLQACFVEYEKDTLGFLNFNDVPSGMKIVEGMEIPVQIVKEASKNKEAVVTMKLSISGVYCIAQTGDGKLSVSHKLSGGDRARIKKELAQELPYNLIVRTNAGLLDDFDELKKEAELLFGRLDEIYGKAETRTIYSMIYKSEPEYVRFVKGIAQNAYERILTDDREIFENLSDFNPSLYTDSFPMRKLYSLETKLDEILSKQVWLKNGGNIVIEHTEALTVIDVNSAKNDAKKNREQVALCINLEAAEEIARQIRIRNISGIILIDFINMNDTASRELLTEKLKQFTSGDNIRCDFVDFTKLGLAELVRQKTKPPVYEVIKFDDYH